MSIEPQKKVQVWVVLRLPNASVKILLLQTTQERGAFWQPVTGWVEAGESLEQAALRELAEETGIVVDSVSPIGDAFEFEKIKKRFRESAFFCQMEGEARREVKLDPREHQAYEWFSVEEALEKVFFKSNKIILSKIASQIL